MPLVRSKHGSLCLYDQAAAREAALRKALDEAQRAAAQAQSDAALAGDMMEKAQHAETAAIVRAEQAEAQHDEAWAYGKFWEDECGRERGRNVDLEQRAEQAERERDEAVTQFERVWRERNEAQAKLDAAMRQEPVLFIRTERDGLGNLFYTMASGGSGFSEKGLRPVYAAPVPAQAAAWHFTDCPAFRHRDESCTCPRERATMVGRADHEAALAAARAQAEAAGMRRAAAICRELADAAGHTSFRYEFEQNTIGAANWENRKTQATECARMIDEAAAGGKEEGE